MEMYILAKRNPVRAASNTRCKITQKKQKNPNRLRTEQTTRVLVPPESHETNDSFTQLSVISAARVALCVQTAPICGSYLAHLEQDRLRVGSHQQPWRESRTGGVCGSQVSPWLLIGPPLSPCSAAPVDDDDDDDMMMLMMLMLLQQWSTCFPPEVVRPNPQKSPCTGSGRTADALPGRTTRKPRER